MTARSGPGERVPARRARRTAGGIRPTRAGVPRSRFPQPAGRRPKSGQPGLVVVVVGRRRRSSFVNEDRSTKIVNEDESTGPTTTVSPENVNESGVDATP